MGSEGSEGPTGPTGATGPTGPSGVPGINGTQFYTLGGGDLGSNVELLFGYTSVLAGSSSPVGTSPIYYGPGNGADTQLESEAVPIDASTVTQLWVQTKSAPGAGQSYTFQLCINSDCTTPTVTCSVTVPTCSWKSCRSVASTSSRTARAWLFLNPAASATML